MLVSYRSKTAATVEIVAVDTEIAFRAQRTPEGPTMTFHSKVRGPGRSAKSLVAGIATINIDQSMRLSRKQVTSGSLKRDWEAVGRDLKGSVRRVKRELESA